MATRLVTSCDNCKKERIDYTDIGWLTVTTERACSGLKFAFGKGDAKKMAIKITDDLHFCCKECFSIWVEQFYKEL